MKGSFADMERVAVIMAGGKGERLWPKSRKSCPKQYLSIDGDGETLIQSTVKRMTAITEIKNVFVVTGKEYLEITKKQLPELPEENIICEPMGKNTTACIGYASQIIRKRYGNAIAMVVPSDHYIKNTAVFASDLDKCCRIAESHNTVVTVGITPTRPETGFGYIKVNKKMPLEGIELAWRMMKFVEKPSVSIARRYISSGRYLWNAGMFVFPVAYMIKCIKRYHPENGACLSAIGKIIGKRNEEIVTYEMFQRMEAISIDYAVMEHIRGSVTVQSTFDWNDVGTWAAMPEIRPADDSGNVIDGLTAVVESSGCIVEGCQGKAIALLGAKDLIVVQTENAVLVCHKDYAQRIKEATAQLPDTAEYL